MTGIVFKGFLLCQEVAKLISRTCFLSYKLSPAPSSIAHLNRSTRKTAKSNLLKGLMIDVNTPDHLPDHNSSSTIYFIDFMVLIQSIQKGESKTFGDLAKVIAESVTSSLIHNERTQLPPNFKEFLMNAKNKASFISFVLNFTIN